MSESAAAQPPFRSYSAYLREKYGTRVYRVAVDGGFGCPHRDAEGGGCIYCHPSGARAPYLPPGAGIAEQVRAAIGYLRSRYGAQQFLLYFQAYTGTNAVPAVLRTVYDEALAAASFRELIVSTRPDCLDRARAGLLAEYLSPRFDVWVELGLQSAHDSTLDFLNRRHTLDDFEQSFLLLRDHGIKVCVHLILGLPGESHDDILHTMRFVAALRPEGVKFHNLHVERGTILGEMFLRGEVIPPSAASHLRLVADALRILPPETVIMRLTSDTPADRLLAPRRFWDKARFRRGTEQLVRGEECRQGCTS